jgi:hypothetical protein
MLWLFGTAYHSYQDDDNLEADASQVDLDDLSSIAKIDLLTVKNRSELLKLRFVITLLCLDLKC